MPTVDVTPNNRIVVPKDVDPRFLPDNWRETLQNIRKSACRTCSPVDPADPSRRRRCNQTEENTWKCNYCRRYELECSWAAGKLLSFISYFHYV